MSIIKRFLEEIMFRDEYRQMRFIVGPRQSGKTTLAKNKLKIENCENFYYNWDSIETRKRYNENYNFLKENIIKSNQKGNIWVCFDEIHKMHKWKNILKVFFDTFENKINFLITESAKLDMLGKGGDSLAGRYFSYKLNPFIVAEVLNLKLIDILPESDGDKTIEKFISKEHENTTIIDQFLKFGPFPEPLLKENEVLLKKWQESYIEKIII